EDVVGLVDFLEVVLAILVARIAIRVILHRELAKGGLEVRLVRAARYAEHFVIVALRHRVCSHPTALPRGSSPARDETRAAARCARERGRSSAMESTSDATKNIMLQE